MLVGKTGRTDTGQASFLEKAWLSRWADALASVRIVGGGCAEGAEGGEKGGRESKEAARRGQVEPYRSKEAPGT